MPDRYAVRTVAVWCPDWPVLAAVRSGVVPLEFGAVAPESRALPVALESRALPIAVLRAGRVVACSPAARAEGIAPGLRRREAQSRCTELLVTDYDAERDARCFEPVVRAIEASCPGVDVVRPGLACVGARGPRRYYGGDAAVADHLACLVAAGCGVPAGVGVADGLFAATLAAVESATRLPPAAQAVPIAAPVVVPVGESARFLADRPIDELERPELVDLLRRLGIRTLGAFAALPAPEVTARFGLDGTLAHRLARGLDVRPLAARPPAPELVTRTVFDPPVQRVDTAAFAARVLAVRFHEQLVNHGLGCLRLGIRARTTGGAELTRSWRHEGALSAAAVADRVRWQLDGWLTASRAGSTDDSGSYGGAGSGNGVGAGWGGDSEDGADADTDPDLGIAELSLLPDQVVAYSGAQPGLWGGRGESGERADTALVRVQGMLGPAAVVTPVPDGGRGPGERIRLVPWGDPREPARIPAPLRTDRAGHGGAVPPWPGRLPAPSPATVFTAPVPAAVLDADGDPVGVSGRYAVTAPPAVLRLAGTPALQILGWAGPWPVDERWWDRSDARRLARFQVVTDDGSARLLVVESGRWWVEAVYD